MYCQKCKTSIRLDGSLEDLNPTSFKLLTGMLRACYSQSPQQIHPSRPPYSQDRREEYDKVAKNARTPVSKRTVPSSRVGQMKRASRDPGGMSFVMLTDSQVVAPTSSHEETLKDGLQEAAVESRKSSKDSANNSNLLSYKLETVQRFFEVLTARSDIDHPICQECTELLVEGMQKRLNASEKERDAYVEYLRQANADIPTEEEQAQAEQELEKARKEQETAFAELERLEREKASMDEEILALDREAQALDEEETTFWRERNAFTMTLSEYQAERDRISNRYDHDVRQSLRLQRTNVYNDTFTISYDGQFATINGLRMGRTPATVVGWEEINAAWGQTCLLLATVAEKLGHTFKGYRLWPMGSRSEIHVLTYPQNSSTAPGAPPPEPKVTAWDLYHVGDGLFSNMSLMYRHFDNGMVCFLDCVKQIYEALVVHNSTWSMPYPIRKDKIRDTSIKLAFAQEENWTRACKDLLTCCKYLLAATSDLDGKERRGSRR
ncbi:autophagy protein Apg6 [Saccharata proteae CBS 121410]|uniref:Autophagy protein Apg6 n=1 Tax=Saccharata proteae CBS 121410 TaxID=1314787 RepID=A0A9P4M0X2_9PEZI|nr:autophagy protein Apg6 [Saccharata proteae CBS 121410]